MAVTEAPGIPTIGVDYSDPNFVRCVSIGTDALLTVDNKTGDTAIHPSAVAFGSIYKGWLTVPGWQGSMSYHAGHGEVINHDHPDWSYCVGDFICTAIAEGRITLRPADELPDYLQPGGIAVPFVTVEPVEPVDGDATEAFQNAFDQAAATPTWPLQMPEPD